MPTSRRSHLPTSPASFSSKYSAFVKYASAGTRTLRLIHFCERNRPLTPCRGASRLAAGAELPQIEGCDQVERSQSSRARR